MSRVHRLFDTSGRLYYDGYNSVTRKYNPCPRYSFVHIEYRRGNVIGKSAYFG